MQHMNGRGSILLFTFKGIPVRLHWSFALLLVWVWYVGMRAGMDMAAIGVLALLVGSLFVCVVMHEFGHALAARRYGVRTRDIILSPIGGVARLDRIPDKPVQELVVALAGPLVNVVIAILLGILAWLLGTGGMTISGDTESAIFRLPNFLPLLLWMNVWLVFFNMIPAFPMDGGRVLRALLAMRYGRLTATRWASIVGRILAVGFIIWAFWRQELFIGLIGVFIYLMATQEYKMVLADTRYRRFNVRDVTRRLYTLIHPHEPAGQVLQKMLGGLEVNFMVGEDSAHPDGYVTAADLIRAREQGHTQTPVAHFIRPFILKMPEEAALTEAFPLFQTDPRAVILVLATDGTVSGLLDRDQIDHVLYWSHRSSKAEP